MPFDTLILFVPACFALNMAFGPNNVLSVIVGAKYGVRTAVLSAIGRLTAFVIMIGIAALGMGALLMASELAFTIAKLLGVAYLVWLGIRMILAKTELQLEHSRSIRDDLPELMRKEFLVAIGNPKAILIFTAFFPQFVAPANYWTSFLMLGAIFLTLEMVAIAIYSFGGTRLSALMGNDRGVRWINRVSGGTMIAFGIMLATAKRPAV